MTAPGNSTPTGRRRKPRCPHGDGPICARCRAGRLRVLGLWAAGFATAAVVLAAFVAWTASRLSGYVEESDAYHDARPCPAGEPAERDCLRDVPAVVRAVIDINGRNSRHELHLTGEGFASRGVSVRASGPMMDDVEVGDAVVATLWRDRIVQVRAGDHVEMTHHTPDDDVAASVMVIAAGTPLILVLGRIARWLVIHRRRVVDEDAQAGVEAWGPMDAGLVSVAVASVVVWPATAGDGASSGLTGQLVTTVVVGIVVFATAWYLTARFKHRTSGPYRTGPFRRAGQGS